MNKSQGLFFIFYCRANAAEAQSCRQENLNFIPLMVNQKQQTFQLISESLIHTIFSDKFYTVDKEKKILSNTF